MTFTSGKTTVHTEAADDCMLVESGAVFHKHLRTNEQTQGQCVFP